MPQSFPEPADDLTLALTDTLRAALEGVPQTDLDAESLATHLAPALSVRLAAAAVAAGGTVHGLARALAARSAASGSVGNTVEARVLAALQRHTAGRSPGVTPEGLAALTGLPQSGLGPAVSALVQAGELVRDAWLVRLPNPDDLLPGIRPAAEERAGEARQLAERRAIGDRRAVGERRLYDRRSSREP